MSKYYVKELKLNVLAVDSWGRTVYQDEKTAELFKDTSLNDKVDKIEDLCTVTKNKIEGEPDTPIPFSVFGNSYFIEMNYKDSPNIIFYKKLEKENRK